MGACLVTRASGLAARHPVVCLTSGGIDSSVMTYLLRNRGFRVLPLFIDYGQVAAKSEASALRRVLPADCRRRLMTVRIPEVARIGGGRLLNPSARSYWVPHRNLLLLTVAGIYATTVRTHLVAIGTIGESSVPVPDADASFVRLASRLLTKSANSTCEVLAPLQYRTKAEVVNLGLKLHVPVSDTWSCYGGAKSPCGACPACLDRDLAIHAAQEGSDA